jgi:hypothetical protein
MCFHLTFFFAYCISVSEHSACQLNAERARSKRITEMLSRTDLTLAQRSHFFRPPLFIHEAITVKHLKLKTETTGTKSSKPGETCATIVTTLNQDKENWFKIFGRRRRYRSPTLTLSAIVALLVDASANKHHLAVPVNAVSIYPALTQLMA